MDAVVRFLNSKVNRALGGMIPAKEGMLYGLELELEGRGVEMPGIGVKGWKREKDGSLRGESIEYVSNGPADYKESRARVHRLFEAFQKHGVRLQNSYRTSTHVHINFMDRKVRDVVNFFVVYTVLEELFEQYCGEGRAGNLFCLPTRDVEGLVGLLERSIFQDLNFRQFHNEVRYCAINLCALNKFGSIEIRTMRGADNEAQVQDWMEILKQLYEFAVNKMESPVRLIESLSLLGKDGFLLQIFDPATKRKLEEAWPADKDLFYSLMEGVRLVQVIAYRMQDVFEAPVPEEKEVQKMAKGGNFVGKAVPFIPEDPFARMDGLRGDVRINHPRQRGLILNDLPGQKIREAGHGGQLIPNMRPKPGEPLHGVERIKWDAAEECWVNEDGEELLWLFNHSDECKWDRVYSLEQLERRIPGQNRVVEKVGIGQVENRYGLICKGNGHYVDEHRGIVYKTLMRWAAEMPIPEEMDFDDAEGDPLFGPDDEI